MAFRDIIGQERAVRALKGVVNRENIPHAFLFSGLPGVGKKTIAIDFAKAINCMQRIENDCCEKCSACVRANSRNYPDLLIIEPSEQFIGIDVVRSLEEELSFPPLEGRRRVIIIDEADKMTNEASNALLKTLEEPPEGNVIILVAPEQAMLLPTIVSRTCHLRFQPLSDDVVEKILISRQFLDSNNAALVAKISTGSVERALKYVESRLLDRRQALRKRILEIISAAPGRMFEIATEWARESEMLLDDIDLLKMWWRDLIIYQLGSNNNLVVDAETIEAFKGILGKSSYTGLMKTYQLFDSIYTDISRRSNKKMAVERLVIGLRESVDEEDSWC